MGCSTSVYLQIRDWNYWWNVYQFGGAEPSVPQGAEFSLTFDQDGEEFYFAFDFYNLSALRQFCSDESEAFVEPDHPDRPPVSGPGGTALRRKAGLFHRRPLL